MKILIEVLGGPEKMPRGGDFQPVAIHYPGRRYPTEDKLFLSDGLGKDGNRFKDADAPLKPGRYEVDLAELLYPNPKQYNAMTIQRLNVSHFKPALATARSA
jgi:hypothetical protein